MVHVILLLPPALQGVSNSKYCIDTSKTREKNEWICGFGLQIWDLLDFASNVTDKKKNGSQKNINM
jgi:hypothetical protein